MKTTSAQKVKFVSDVSKTLREYDKVVNKQQELIDELAKKINVTSVYHLSNLTRDIQRDISTEGAKFYTVFTDTLEEFRKDPHMQGEFKSQVARAQEEVDTSRIIARELPNVSENSDGNENMSASLITELEDAVLIISKSSEQIILDLSSQATAVKNDTDSNLAVNIGKNLERFTNSQTRKVKNMVEQIESMRQDKRMQFNRLSETTSRLNSVKTANANASIIVDGAVL